MRSEEDFLIYIEQAEQRIAAATAPLAEQVRTLYAGLSARFPVDLGEGRDAVVSRAALLMFAEAMLDSSAAVAVAAMRPASRAPAAAATTTDEIDTQKLDRAALAVAYESLHDHNRVWKGFDFGITARWHEQGLIESPRGFTKSMVLTAEGLRRAKEAYLQLFRTD